MDVLIAGSLMLGLIILANILHARDRRAEKIVFDAFLFLGSAFVLLFGLILVLIPTWLYQEFAEESLDLLNPAAFGFILVLSAGLSMAFCIGKVRQLMAKIMPINPDSPVHSLALVLSVYLIGYTALTLTQGGLVEIAESAQATPLWLLVMSSLMFAVIGILGVGFPVRRRGKELIKRLGLEMPTAKQMLVAFVVIIVLVGLEFCAGLVLSLLNPEQSAVLEDVSTALLYDIDTVWEWFILALAVGIGEELLFRGALQPSLGLGFTSVLFALVHIQYGFTLVTLFIVFIALILGLLRRYYNTTVTIFVHAGYNFALGIMALLFTYLQQFAP
ncbi:MAG: lysostaphin resistance A-like protein [Candidatus Promineifilaceae bacterium]